MWTAQYWKALAEEAVVGFSAGFLGATGMTAVDILHLDWKAALGLGAGGALVVVVKGLGLKNVGAPQSPSVVK